MTLTATVFLVILAAVLSLAIFVAPTVWVVRTVTGARRETATAVDDSNQLIMEYLRNITEQLDRIEAQLSEIPEQSGSFLDEGRDGLGSVLWAVTAYALSTSCRPPTT